MRQLIDMTHIRAPREKAGFSSLSCNDQESDCAYTDGVGESDKSVFRIIDNWPDTVPVTLQEVEVVDRFLGSILDAFLRSLS